MNPRVPIITITTDFGTRDSYVGAMKGVLLQHLPHVQLVDISHEIFPQDILQAALVLREASRYFPIGTTHLVVIDPGVGSEREAIALESAKHYFVGPNNGVLSIAAPTPSEAVVIQHSIAGHQPVEISHTFHGRDLFAPAAAQIAAGIPLSKLGTPLDRYHRLELPSIDYVASGNIIGKVLAIDHFGNAITNIGPVSHISNGITLDLYEGESIILEEPLSLEVGGITVPFHQTYSNVATGELLALIGSGKMVEIAVREGSANELGIERGDTVSLSGKPNSR
ncbi:MAG: SAM-dependent chlorinase/fluorinase [Chloroflexota bacterium]